MDVIAIVAIRNGEVHVARCLSDLITSGVQVVLIDHDSQDRTVDIARDFLGRGLRSIERLPWTGLFTLKTILEAKAQIIASLSCDWVMHVDVDEWHCPPWPGMRLIDAIERVDAAGYDCINFEEMTFVSWPHEDFNRPDYAQLMMTYYFFEPSKLRLMRAWKRSLGASNVENAGHRLNAATKIFPENFILRHYIALSSEYLYLKYHHRPFDPAAVALGWHHSAEYKRIGLTQDMCMLRPSPHLKQLPAWTSNEFDKSHPARKHYWQWSEYENNHAPR